MTRGDSFLAPDARQDNLSLLAQRFPQRRVELAGNSIAYRECITRST